MRRFKLDLEDQEYHETLFGQACKNIMMKNPNDSSFTYDGNTSFTSKPSNLLLRYLILLALMLSDYILAVLNIIIMPVFLITILCRDICTFYREQTRFRFIVNEIILIIASFIGWYANIVWIGDFYYALSIPFLTVFPSAFLVLHTFMFYPTRHRKYQDDMYRMMLAEKRWRVRDHGEVHDSSVKHSNQKVDW